ncbi:MAG: hypothetical protein KDD61_05730 [Bdellovibrionales bacterium]|nr:hypothetical protein [Bdellovibrionales bacterium]
MTVIILVRSLASLFGVTLFFLLRNENILQASTEAQWGIFRIFLVTVMVSVTLVWKRPQISSWMFALLIPLLSLPLWWILQSLLGLDSGWDILKSTALSIVVTPLALMTFWPEFVSATSTIFVVDYFTQKWILKQSQANT